MWQPETHDGRSVYRMRKRNLILYFHGPRRAWAIGDTVGSLAPYAYVEDKSVYPGTSTISPAGRGWPGVAYPLTAVLLSYPPCCLLCRCAQFPTAPHSPPRHDAISFF